MNKTKKGIFGNASPLDAQHVARAVSSFRKYGDRGPFHILLDLERIPQNARYLQVVVDFNEQLTGKGSSIIRLSQLGVPYGLISREMLAGPPAAYPIEQWRRQSEEEKNVQQIQDPQEEPSDSLCAHRENVEGCGTIGSEGISPWESGGGDGIASSSAGASATSAPSSREIE